MAGQQFNISFVIGAVDNLSLKVMQINDKVNKAFAPLQKLGSATNFLSSELGFNKIGKALGNVGEKGQAAFRAMKEAGLLLVGALATVGAAFNFVVLGAGRTAAEISDASNRIGISTDSFQALQFAATQSGFSMQRLEPVLTKFSQVLGEASDGNSEAAQIFRALGVSIHDSSGMLKSMDDILPSLADNFRRIENPSVRNAAAVKLFGKEGVKFINVMAGGSKGLEEFKAKAQSLGLVLDKDMLEKGAKLDAQWEGVQLTFSRLRDSIGAELFPVMKDLLTQLTEIFIANKPAIIEFAKAFAKDLPGTLKSLSNILGGVWAAMQPVLAVFKAASDIFGGANVVFATLAVIITGKLILAIYALGAALVQLGIITAATPIGIIAIGIGLVIAAIAALIVYWQPIKNFFVGLFDIISQSPFAVLLGPLGAFAFLGRKIYDNWQPISNLFSAIGTSIANAGSAVGRFFGLGNATGGTGAASSAPGIAEQLRTTGNGVSSTESRVVVDFNNLPTGTRIKTEKAETPLDLNLGYGMATP